MVAPQRDSWVYGFSAYSSTWVLRVSMPLLPMIRLPKPGMPLPHGCPPFIQNAPFGKRLPSVNTKPSLLTTRATVALVFQSPSLLRMPRLNWSEYGTLMSLLIASYSWPWLLACTSACRLARSRYFGSHGRHGVPVHGWVGPLK